MAILERSTRVEPGRPPPRAYPGFGMAAGTLVGSVVGILVGRLATVLLIAVLVGGACGIAWARMGPPAHR